MSEQDDTPGVIAPPPLIYGVGIAIGLVLNSFIPLPFVPNGLRVFPGALLVTIGLGLGFWAIIVMRRRDTSPLPEQPTTAIVSEGPFGFSRNPIYLGFTAITLGFAIWANTFWLVILLLLVLVIMHYGVISREERYLTRKFGDEYLQYKARVRRWL